MVGSGECNLCPKRCLAARLDAAVRLSPLRSDLDRFCPLKSSRDLPITPVGIQTQNPEDTDAWLPTAY